jgi:hypothetical protein
VYPICDGQSLDWKQRGQCATALQECASGDRTTESLHEKSAKR